MALAKDHLEYLSWSFMLFEAIWGLKINMERSELGSVGSMIGWRC